MTKAIYDQFGQAIRIYVQPGDNGLTNITTVADHQSLLDDNAVARSMDKRADSMFTPFARYHPAMEEHWRIEDGMSPQMWRKMPYKEKALFIEKKLQSRDYRKHMRRHVKGLFV